MDSNVAPPEAWAGDTVSMEPGDDVAPAPDAGLSRWMARGLAQLQENFYSIIRARAIFYPVAYQFGRELGRGRQGIVFEAYRQGARGCRTRHALKFFDPAIYASVKKYWTDMGRVAGQISRLQSVNAPNLVGRDLYEEVNGVGYLQMEAIDGLDCHNLLYGNHFDVARQRTSPEEWARFSDVIFRFEENKVRIQPGVALYLLRQALRGLEALHDAGFVHCDVKPSNMMCDRLGYLKLVDYGRATLVGEKVNFLLGSPLFMAPEIHRRERYSAMSDLYSLGLVALELLRGEPVFNAQGMDEARMLEIKLDLQRRVPELVPPHVKRNEAFVAVLRKFLDPNPENRYRSAEEAETGTLGLALLHKQLTILGKDSEYYRDLESYLSKLYPNPSAWPPPHDGMKG